MRFWIGVVLAGIVAGIVAGCSPEVPLSGSARVIDGDTLSLAGQSIRLSGIDAPELDQRCGETACGRDARNFLTDAVAGRNVTCRSTALDQYGRTLATCAVDGTDLGALMVLSGHAVAYRRYSNAYVAQERAARAAGRGVWAADSFDMPWDHRAARRAGIAGTENGPRLSPERHARAGRDSALATDGAAG